LPFDWCKTDQPPDQECFAAKRDPDSQRVALALAIAEKQVELHPPETVPWYWEDAVLMIAMNDLFLVTGQTWLRDYLRAWMDHHIDQGFAIEMSDTCVPAAVAAALYGQSGDPRYKAVVDEALHYLYQVAARTPEGGISHLGTLMTTVWTDSLFMFGNVLIRWGEVADDAQALDEFGSQFEIQTSLLQQPSGFYNHAHDWVVEMTPDCYWGRGNGWVVAAGYQYLRVRTLRGEEHPAVADALHQLGTAVLAAQEQDSGLWWRIMSRPQEVYLETSAAALFAYGFARGWRYGLLADDVLPAVHRAVEGVISRVETDEEGRPVVTGVSGPTTADLCDGYGKVARVDDPPFGLGAVVLALIETSGLPHAR